MLNANDLATKFGLDSDEAEELLLWVNGKIDATEEELFEKLYSYFTKNGEMPYSVAKCRSGDPHEWIQNKLREDQA